MRHHQNPSPPLTRITRANESPASRSLHPDRWPSEPSSWEVKRNEAGHEKAQKSGADCWSGRRRPVKDQACEAGKAWRILAESAGVAAVTGVVPLCGLGSSL